MQEEPKKDEKDAREKKEKEKWINSDPTTLAEHKGKGNLACFLDIWLNQLHANATLLDEVDEKICSQ
jgi:hypothetical protein